MADIKVFYYFHMNTKSWKHLSVWVPYKIWGQKTFLAYLYIIPHALKYLHANMQKENLTERVSA